ncbi:radical SAM protein [Desulfonatronospira sp.]|uniref:radical SAM protein n=1 Tax=Desulfonatronospira sp. TaxID=1962951 RepID=UPI0025C1C75F|nr:radical SAM protein [Desulfonatronospira sp.]
MTTDKIQSFPSRIVLELTPDCNLSCPMCPRQHIKLEESYMTWEMYKKLLDEIQEENSQAVVLPFWRGESCMHPEFLEMLDYALSQDFRIHLSTNGHFMSREHMEVFYRCEFVTFSLHTDKGFQNACRLVENRRHWGQTKNYGLLFSFRLPLFP